MNLASEVTTTPVRWTRCPHCRGTGGWFHSPCAVCLGAGMVAQPVPTLTPAVLQ